MKFSAIQALILLVPAYLASAASVAPVETDALQARDFAPELVSSSKSFLTCYATDLTFIFPSLVRGSRIQRP